MKNNIKTMMILIMILIGIGNKRMSTMKKIKFHVSWSAFREVNKAIKDSGVKFYPFVKAGGGYHITIEPADHPIVSFLTLAHDIRVLSHFE